MELGILSQRGMQPFQYPTEREVGIQGYHSLLMSTQGSWGPILLPFSSIIPKFSFTVGADIAGSLEDHRGH